MGDLLRACLLACRSECLESFARLAVSALLILLAPLLPSLLPCRGDLVQIETWFQEDGKLAAQRDFLITELGSGRVLGRATSTWVTINIAVRGWLAGWLAVAWVPGCSLSSGAVAGGG